MPSTPDQSRKSGFTVVPSPAPFLTPRFERRRIDARWVEGGFNHKNDREKEVNVQVIVRCRPLNDDEQRMNTSQVISCNEQRREVTILQNVGNRQVDRAFTFDKVFGPKVHQTTIYDQAIQPIVNEVLEGFNCTIFAYGQTSTGKTYTMEGGMKSKGGELPVDAGVIPRTVRQIIENMEAQKADYSMKVTFLELYNEEITDLLAPEDSYKSMEDKHKKTLSLMEDGKGGVVVRGLEEEMVYSASEIYNLLERGSSKRRAADTLLNKHSSRAHSIFSITVHIREANIGNEEIIKCGKLNLVDLAGSENISRSGVREGRAREAGEINKSLLTLGRVITALVEHSGHVPYRDSKLTRLLRDSLGGKAKTCIIATISPSAVCLEETLSTLDYACRAKNIRNKPEVNQKLSKTVLLRDLYVEIERMKQDVRAARMKNGVYIPHERFLQEEADKKAITDKIERMEFDLDLKGKESDKLGQLYQDEQQKNMNLERQIEELKISLENNNQALQDIQEKYRIADLAIKEKSGIISNLLHSECAMLEQTKDLRNNLQNASDDMTSLFIKLDQKNKMEEENHKLVLAFGSQLDQMLKDLHKVVVGSVSQQHQHLRHMEEQVGSFLACKYEATKVLESRIKSIEDTYSSGISSMREAARVLEKKASSDLEQMQSALCTQIFAVENLLQTALSEAHHVLDDIHCSLDEQSQIITVYTKQHEEGLQRSLMSAQSITKAAVSFCQDLRASGNRVMAMIDETHEAKITNIASFERRFQEESAKEEKLALERVAEILANFTVKKTSSVLVALEDMKNASLDESRLLKEEILNMQKVSTIIENDWNSYTDKLESQFKEDKFSTTETGATMSHITENCSRKADASKEQLDNTQSAIEQLHRCSSAETEYTLKEKTLAYKTSMEQVVSLSSSTERAVHAETNDIITAINDALLLDHGSKAEIESVSTSCFNQLKRMKDSHSSCVADMRSLAENHLRKEYLVDEPCMLPERRVIQVPTMDSINYLRSRVEALDLDIELAAEKSSVNKNEDKQEFSVRLVRHPLSALNLTSGALR